MTVQPSVPDTAAGPDADRQVPALPSPREPAASRPALRPLVPAPRRVGPAGPRPSPTPRAPAGLDTPVIDGLYRRPAPTGRTSALAVTAVVAGGVVPPLGVVLGIAALRRLRDRGDSGRGLAIWGIVLGATISLLLVLGAALTALAATSGPGPGAPGGPVAPAGAVSEVCSGAICTVTARGAPVTVDGIGEGGTDGVTVLAIGEGTAAVASREGPLDVPTGTALELALGTQVVLTQAGADTVVLVYQRALTST